MIIKGDLIIDLIVSETYNVKFSFTNLLHSTVLTFDILDPTTTQTRH